MALYHVTGTGIASGRARRKVVKAYHEQQALELARESGMEPHAVERLPDAPATERQLAYAKDLGITIHDGATLREISSLISIQERKDKPARTGLIDIARDLGVDAHDHIGKRELFRLVANTLADTDSHHALASWFIYRVARSLREENIASDPIDHPLDERVSRIAEVLIADKSAMQSIRRYEPEKLIWFGTWTAPDGMVVTGGSVRTIAYGVAAEALRRQFMEDLRLQALRDAPARAARIAEEDAREAARAAERKAAEPKGCLGVIICAIGLGWMAWRSLLG